MKIAVISDIHANMSAFEKVLEDIDLKVRRARTVALVGESGSGKSTLARVITGLLPPLEGKVLYGGKELPPDERRFIISIRSKYYQEHLASSFVIPDRGLLLLCYQRGEVYIV